MRLKYFFLISLTCLLILAGCGGIKDYPPKELGKEILKKHYTETENLSVNLFDFRGDKKKSYHTVETDALYYVLYFRAKVELPATPVGVERRTVEGKLGFKKIDTWKHDKEFKIILTIRETKFNFHGVKPSYHSRNPIYGGACPRNDKHFITINDSFCPACRNSNQKVAISWEKELSCLDCQGSGQCAYCRNPAGHSPLTCNLCQGDGQCSACEGKGLCPFCANEPTPGTIRGEKCEACSGTGKCALCQEEKQCNYCAGEGVLSMKCQHCSESGNCSYCSRLKTPPGQAFGEDCKFCQATGKCSHCQGTGIACFFCGASKQCRYCQGKKSFKLSDLKKGKTTTPEKSPKENE